MLETVLAILLTLAVGCGVTWFIMRKRMTNASGGQVRTETIAERVRSVGKLVGLEVHAKEIATSTKGWSWLPPLLLSQARIAMIFHFEKQYGIDLARIRPSDVEELEPASLERPARYRLYLPPLEGSLRLTDVTPYDVQAGRILGLVDVIQMNAQTQGALIRSAQEQASGLFQRNAERYESEARHSIERRLTTFLRLFDAYVELIWPDDEPEKARPDVKVDESLNKRFEHS